MNVLAVNIDDITIHMLRQSGVTVEICEYEETFEIEYWADPTIYSLIIVNLEHAGGLFICRPLRKIGNNIPVIGIASRDPERTFSDLRATFLENGGDDLLPNPLNVRELMASVRAVLRRASGALASDIFALEKEGNRIDVDLRRGQVFINGQRPILPSTGERLLVMFATRHGRIVTKDQIINYLYSDRPNSIPETKIVDVFICKVRAKIDEIVPGLGIKLIKTEWGRGYGFDAVLWKDKKNETAIQQSTVSI